MKYIIVIIDLLFLVLLFSPVKILAAPDCNFNINSSVSTADGTGNFSSVRPGDTVCLPAGSRQKLNLANFHGAQGNPITFINSGGIVTINNSGNAGIDITNSNYIRISGTGVSANCGRYFNESQQQCGIQIDSTTAGTYGRGIQGGARTDNIELDHIEIRNGSEAGISVKTKENIRGQWVQYNTSIHHNYIHDNNIDEGSEGMYIGSSDYDLGLEPELNGVDIGYNLVARTGWDGIQVGSAIANCRIHHNIILQDSLANVLNQTSGMMINRGSVCDAYNNFLKGGNAKYGIYVQGNGGNKIYNNIIVDRMTNDGRGITVATGSNTNNSIYVFNNTLVNIQSRGISFGNTVGSDNRVQNNIVINVSGGTYISAGIAITSNNLTGQDINFIRFINPGNDDYSLQSGSPAINAGTNLSGYGIIYDFADRVRPQAGVYDIGAYEYVSSVVTTPTPLPPTPTVTPTSSPSCPLGSLGNLNCDSGGLVNETDLSILLSKWTTSGPLPTPGANQFSANLNNDIYGKVDESDLAILLSHWKT